MFTVMLHPLSISIYSNIFIRSHNLLSQIGPRREVSLSNFNTVREAPPNATSGGGEAPSGTLNSRFRPGAPLEDFRRPGAPAGVSELRVQGLGAPGLRWSSEFKILGVPELLLEFLNSEFKI